MRISSPKMWQNFIFLILQLFLPCVLCIEITLEPTPPFAETKSGWVEGYIQKTVGGHQIVAFEGIKYAEAPTGQLRFRFTDAIPPDPAKKSRLVGKLPVLIYIHGGGYIYGRSSEIGAAYLLNKQNVILVTINYRLGVLGFFTTGDDEASGNWGMKDQALAIKWVVKNIKNFGGDPQRITLVGNSAGAASVGLHMVSPQSKDLFQRAILESGSQFTIWAVQNETYSSSLVVAREMGCHKGGNSAAMVSCLRAKDADWMVGRSIKAWRMLLLSRLPFGPVVESVWTKSLFLTEAPEVSYRNGRVSRVPMIVGLNKDEGSIFAAGIQFYPGYRTHTNLNWNCVIPYALSFEDRTTAQNAGHVAQKIKTYYLGKDPKITFRNRNKWMKFFGDRLIVQGVHAIMEQHSKIAPTYGYMFSYAGERSIVQTSGLNRDNWGVAHTNEMLYLYNNTKQFPNMNETSKDFKVSETLVNLWTSFAEAGIPSLHESDYRSPAKIWKPISPTAMKLLEINSVNQVPRMIKFPQDISERVEFWKSLGLRGDPVFP
ncbi:esterase E4 [Folsomia candida]|uniref:esterase E4 n=1 Tax=Folsomia candida TaxID=158441 RepID=UPI001604B0BC|nr:esterase E4 [Folsomia candida]